MNDDLDDAGRADELPENLFQAGEAEACAAAPASLDAFPLGVLPGACSELLSAFSHVVSGQVEFAIAPFFAVLSTALGPRIEVRVRDWVACPMLWLCTVATSGSGKSPTAKLILTPIREADGELARLHREARREGTVSKPRRCCYVTDLTMAGLIDELERAQGHGLLVHSDEIANLLHSFVPGTHGRRERSQWLSLWGRDSIRQARRTAYAAEVEQPFAAVLGGTQPRLLRSLGVGDHDGASARFLWVHGVAKPHGLGEGAGLEALTEWKRLVSAAFGLAPAEVPLSEQAANVLDQKSLGWSTTAHDLDEADRALESYALLKAGEYCLRLAALLWGTEAALHSLGRWARPEPQVSAPLLERAAVLTDWFMRGAYRTARLLREPPPRQATGARPLDRELVERLRLALKFGAQETRKASDWGEQLGLEASPSALGRAFRRMSLEQLHGLSIRQAPRSTDRGWEVTREADDGEGDQ